MLDTTETLDSGETPAHVIFLLRTGSIRPEDEERAIKIVSSSPRRSFEYCFFKQERVLQLESIILTDIASSVMYSLGVLKRRWRVIEDKVISSDMPFPFISYLDHFKGRWEDKEVLIFKSPNRDNYLHYLKGISN